MPSSSQDSDSSSLRTLTDSLAPQLYRYQGDRRYQSLNEDYAWPCDSIATTFELRIALILEKTYLNGLYWEPFDGALKRVLEGQRSSEGPVRMMDLGSGTTASWALSMAQRFTWVECIGVDLIPTELIYLPAPDDFFSLIHCRFGRASSSFLSLPSFLDDVARVLRPGGIFLSEETHSIAHPFIISPSNPRAQSYLPALRARHALRMALLPHEAQDVDEEPIADKLRGTSAFEEPVRRFDVDLPFGTRPNEGPPQNQRGSLVRDGRIDAWEMRGAAAGWDRATLCEMRREDERVFPEEDVGISMRIEVVWAVKKRQGG